MSKLKQLIGEAKAIFASVFCLLSFVLLAPSVQADDYNWTRKVVATEPDPQNPEEVQSPYVLEEYKTYTAEPLTATGLSGYGAAFFVNEGATLTGTNVTFEGNKTTKGYGGAIYSKGSVTLKDTVFKNNTASSAGALRVQYDKATATLDGVTFEGNSATWDGAINNFEGTIILAGRVELKTASDAWCNKPKSTVSWDLTGGLEHYGTLVNFQLMTNQLDNKTGALTVTQKILIADDQQAGDYVIASGDFSKVKKAYTENFSITNVLGGAGLPVTINGDAVTTADKLTVYKLVTEEAGETTHLVFKITKYTCKRAVVKAGASTNLVERVYTAEPTTKNGGAFYLSNDATLTCTNGEFAANEANYGGAIYNYSGNVALKGAVFKDNKASSGGAIMNFGTLSLDGVTFEGNTADFGGAIMNSNGFTLNLDGAVTLKTATDTLHNSGTLNWNLTGGKQGVLNGYDKLTTESAGKLWLLVEDYATATNFVIATGEFSNTTGKDTFIIKPYLPVKIDGDVVASADGWYGYTLVTEEAGATTNLVLYVTKYPCKRTELKWGDSTNLVGGVYTAAPTTTADGGAFKVNLNARLTGGTEATFANNEAKQGGAIFNGGAVALTDATFTGNKAAGDGGAIYNAGGGTLSLNGITFEGNTATKSGGAIYNMDTVHFDGAVTLKTATDTILNTFTLNWNLADGKAGRLNGYQNVTNDGKYAKLQLTVDSTTTLPAVIATGDFSNVAGKDTFTIKNGEATATIKIGGVANVGGVWYMLSVEADGLTLSKPPIATLSNVEIIDATTGATNATAKVSVGAAEVAPNADGSYTVPKGRSITVVYTATDDYMFDRFGAKTKTVTVGPLTDDYAMTDDDKPATEAAWVDVREIALDTRTRIVVTSPEEVLPIAYSTNNWGEVTADQTTVCYSRDGEYVTVVDTTNENGYVEWQPTDEEYGKYTFYQSWYSSSEYLTKTNATICYSTYFPLTLAESKDGTYVATTNGVEATGSFDILGYSYVNLTATPESHYQLAGWTATTNGVTYAGGFTNAATLVTRFEMPNSETTLNAAFSWQSTFTEKKTINEGETWEVFAGDDYKKGLENSGTVVWKPGVTNKLGIASFMDAFEQLTNKQGGKLQIFFDASLTNGTYLIATDAQNALGATFEITNGTDAKDCTVVLDSGLETADWTYVGVKRFKLYVTDGGGYELRLLVEWGIPMALDFAPAVEGGSVTVSTNGAAITSGTKVYPCEKVTLVFTPSNRTWQVSTNALQLVDATNKTYGVKYFQDVTLAGANFKMPETNATLSVRFVIADGYRAELLAAATNSYLSTSNNLETLRLNRLTDWETDKAIMIAGMSFDTAVYAISGATKPGAAKDAFDTLERALDDIEEKAQEASGDKPYDFVIASDFSANPPFEDWNEDEGTFTWNGRTWTVGTDAFTSFTDAFTNETLSAFATNLHVFGAQTIASEPPMVAKWNLDLVAYEDGEDEILPVLTVAKDDDTGMLVNITNELGAITGKGVIVLGKAESGEYNPSIYDEFIKGEVEVVNAGVEQEKKDGNVTVNVDKTAKTETTEEGATAVVLPGVENPDGGFKLTVEETATNDVLVAGSVKVAGDVKITNMSTNELTIASTVEAEKVAIWNTNDGGASGAEGSIVATEIVATGDVDITNDAHLEANVVAGGDIRIRNCSPETIVGTYDGKTVSIEGDKAGAISNVTFVSDGPVALTGVNVLTGPFAIDAPENAITNFGTFAWDVRGANHTTTLADFNAVEFSTTITNLQIWSDQKQEIGTYELARNAGKIADMVDAFGNTCVTVQVVRANASSNLKVAFGKGWHRDIWNGRWYKLQLNQAGSLELLVLDARTTFDADEYSVPEGGTVRVRVRGGSGTHAVQATLSYVKNTGSFSAVYLGGERVSFPLTLSWAKGEMGVKEFVFQTSATKRIEEDRYFTLRLSAPVGEDVFAGHDVCKVTIVDSGVAEDDYVRALAYPANAGSVSGAGTLSSVKSYRMLTASAKKYATFAGWYKAKADDPNVIDLSAPVAPYSKRYPKQIRVGYGTENEAGTYFAYFTNVLEVAAVVEPQAIDKDTGKSLPGVAGVTAQNSSKGIYSTYVGVKFALPVEIADDSGKGKLSVSWLPSGLSLKKVDGKYVIAGVPTRAGTFEAKFVASNDAGKHTVMYDFEVAEIPSNAVGTFYGLIDDAEDRTGVGSVTFTAGKTGSLSAKVMRRQSGTHSFSVKGYDYIDEKTFGVAITNRSGEVFEAQLNLKGGHYNTTLAGTAFGGEGKKWTLAYYGETNGTFAAIRNAFDSKNDDASAQQVLAAFRGTYAADLSQTNGVEEAGTVQYRVNSSGNVYVAATINRTYDGEKAVSKKTLSGTVSGGLLYDWQHDLGSARAALRGSGAYLWSAEAFLDFTTRDANGQARYIRPNAEDKTEVVDVDQFVGD